MRLYLPDVMLTNIDNVAVDLAAMAVADCTRQIDFGGVLVLPPSPGKTYAETLLDVVPQCFGICTHTLIVQYDSWVLDAGLWRDEWLEYDYIGAPWPWYKDDRMVGNGGFSLRSKRLMNFLAQNSAEYPLLDPEDAFLCRHYRPALEALGFRWAPMDVASAFAFEREVPHPAFGFHGIFNWPHVLTPEGLMARMAYSTKYVREKPEWRELDVVRRLEP